MTFYPIFLPLILTTIKFDLHFNQHKGDVFTLVSPDRNVTISLNGNTLFADDVAIAQIQNSTSVLLSIGCLSETSLHFSTADSNVLIHSPSICSNISGLLINPPTLPGCIADVFHVSRLIVTKLCGNDQQNKGKMLLSSLTGTLQPVYIAEPLEVNEGGSIPIQWKNVYIFPEHSRLNISNNDILFSITENPQHGQILMNGHQTHKFAYSHLLSRQVSYQHDGSESSQDAFEFQLEMGQNNVNFPFLETTSYTINIKINPVNDIPELLEVKNGQVVKISSRGSRLLTTDILRLSDADDGPDKVRVQVVEERGVHIRVHNYSVNEFTQRQLINRQVTIHDDGIFEKGMLRLVARDGEARSQVLTIYTLSTPIDVRLKYNTGLSLLHHASVTIKSSNLSFGASVPDLPIFYNVVGLPEHGVIECSTEQGQFANCGRFSQQQVENEYVRYRHTNSQHSTHDVFSFQVETGDYVSMVHNFRITFISINVKVFNREPFVLNSTDTGCIDRRNLFAWTFPKSFSPEELIYHIEEPPKFGILSRRIGTKNRRIGVSSNFTQQDIDNGLIQYKLHFMQYSIVNDFFLFRVVSSAVSSQSQRFEIVFIPSESSIQLVNRTVFVDEGQKTAITSDFLSLSTPDDKSFVFSITIPPVNGNLMLKVAGGGTVALLRNQNFTSRDILEKNLFYFHSGTETKSDRTYFTAQSISRSDRKIPFWLSFSVILINDNFPKLIGSDILDIISRGERILYPNLLKWVDEDIDALSLTFDFQSIVKMYQDAAVLSTVSPHRPITLFSSTDLQEEKIKIRHLGHRNNVTIPYTVSDGKHSVNGTLRLIASDPFLRPMMSSLTYCCLPGDTPFINLSPSNLSVFSNLDIKSSEIVYSFFSKNFYKKNENEWKSVNSFTQQDIEDHRVGYRISNTELEDLTVDAGEHSIKIKLEITRQSLGTTLDLKRILSLHLPVSGAVLIDNHHLEQGDGVSPAEELFFKILRQPREGFLVLESENVRTQMGLIHFSQKDVDLGRLQYVHSSKGAGRDSLDFNISNPHVSKGPFTLYFDIYEHFISLSTGVLTMSTGGSVVLSPTVINVTASDLDKYFIKIVSPPSYGWLVKDTWNVHNITSLSSFSGIDLQERRVIYVSDKTQSSQLDHFSIVACIAENTCSEKQLVQIQISRKNLQSPRVIRNEILRTYGEKTMISNSHLDTDDPDTPAESVLFLISRPSIGHIAHIDQPHLPIYNFSQKDIDDNLITFVCSPNATKSGGFSFLLWDGLHQMGPEWFTIENSASHSPILETNGRLIAAPKSLTIIGADLLHANLPKTHSEEVIFTVTIYPKHGMLLVNGKSVSSFSQADINNKVLWYSTEDVIQKEWTRKDFFEFMVTNNNSVQRGHPTFRFRILSTYAVADSNFLTTSPLIVSKGGGVALNESHLDLHKLVAAVSNEVLLIAIAKPPTRGYVEWVDDERGVITVSEFQRGVTVIYRHYADDNYDDSIIFFIYPVSETTKRSSRLRVAIPITISTHRDPLIQINYFPNSINMMSGGFTKLNGSYLSVSHPQVPPQSILYEIIQAGKTGAGIRVNGFRKNVFSQEEVNQGLVELIHQTVPVIPTSNDAIVFSIEGHIRALLVKILPMDLTLHNHSVIEYPQGKTYVVLNKTHLGAFSNGNGSSVVYTIVVGPQNGSLYWVAGEKELNEFTQDDIDNGRVLYAQLNMHSFKDSFEFIVTNNEKESVRNRSEIRVRPLVDVQPVIVESGTTTPLTASQLNASLLQSSIPRFIVATPPKYGRITMEPASNQSVFVFTYPDILRGKVYYQAFSSAKEIVEQLELEIRAEGVQPARIILVITIIPFDGEIEQDREDASTTSMDVPKIVPGGDQMPAIILGIILVSTVFILLCFNRNTKKKKEEIVPPTPTRLPSSPRTSPEKSDLLGSTVFASVGRLPETPRQPLKTFTTPLTPRVDKRQPPTLDYAGLSGDSPASMPLFRQVNAQNRGATHFWV